MKICVCGSEVLNETTHRDPARNTHAPDVVQEVDFEPWTDEDQAAHEEESSDPAAE